MYVYLLKKSFKQRNEIYFVEYFFFLSQMISNENQAKQRDRERERGKKDQRKV